LPRQAGLRLAFRLRARGLATPPLGEPTPTTTTTKAHRRARRSREREATPENAS